MFKYLLQTLHALRAAHAQRVYHRGLKPEQLLIDGYGNVKVSDFGFTRIVERDHAVIRQIYVGMGNVAYMAPELYSDPMTSGPQGDIYALGIIFYELLTRKLPGRRSPMPSQLNSNLPRGIDDIFDRMTRDSRSERYATVDDILDDIDKLEGMDQLLGSGDRVLVGDSPLASIKFRPGAEEPLVGTPVDAEGEDGDKKAVAPAVLVPAAAQQEDLTGARQAAAGRGRPPPIAAGPRWPQPTAAGRCRSRQVAVGRGRPP